MNEAASAGGLRSAQRVGDELHLVLNASLDAIEAGRLELAAILDDQPPKVVNRVEVIFEELVANIVRHGFADGAPHSLHVWASGGPDGVDLTLEDDGVPFDPFAEVEPDAFTTLEDARIGGLGIPLVRRLSARAAYAFEPPRTPWSDKPVNRVQVTITAA